MAYTTIDNSELHFQIKLYTGNDSDNHSITLDGSENMQPDWLWIKQRGDAGYDHSLTDSVRGSTKMLYSDLARAEDTHSTGVKSFDSDGFTLGTDDGSGGAYANLVNYTKNYVAWCWKAGGSASSNSNGSITSSVSASTAAGFSVVSWTGTGSNATVGHGLGAVPKMLIVKNREGSSDNWAVYHEDLGANNWLKLNTTDASATDTVMWNNTTPTSSVFSVGTYTNSNGNTNGMIAYCFADVKGHLKIGSYVGNGNADGPFVYTGFKSAWVMVKQTGSGKNWVISDSARSDVPNANVNDQVLYANLNNSEESSSGLSVDLVSNGFKVRGNGGDRNTSGATYIYMAIAESPFVNSSGVPTNAR